MGDHMNLVQFVNVFGQTVYINPEQVVKVSPMPGKEETSIYFAVHNFKSEMLHYEVVKINVDEVVHMLSSCS